MYFSDTEDFQQFEHYGGGDMGNDLKKPLLPRNEMGGRQPNPNNELIITRYFAEKEDVKSKIKINKGILTNNFEDFKKGDNLIDIRSVADHLDQSNIPDILTKEIVNKMLDEINYPISITVSRSVKPDSYIKLSREEDKKRVLSFERIQFIQFKGILEQNKITKIITKIISFEIKKGDDNTNIICTIKYKIQDEPAKKTDLLLETVTFPLKSNEELIKILASLQDNVDDTKNIFPDNVPDYPGEIYNAEDYQYSRKIGFKTNETRFKDMCRNKENTLQVGSLDNIIKKSELTELPQQFQFFKLPLSKNKDDYSTNQSTWGVGIYKSRELIKKGQILKYLKFCGSNDIDGYAKWDEDIPRLLKLNELDLKAITSKDKLSDISSKKINIQHQLHEFSEALIDPLYLLFNNKPKESD